MSSNGEFVPLDYLDKFLRLWWVLIACAVIGGGIGFLIHLSKPPIYEAQAVFMGSIDFNKIDFMHPPAPTPAPYQLTQYDEDITLVLVEASLRQVVPQVVTYAQQNGWPFDAAGLLNQSTIEREHGFWYLRFRSQDPALAQKLVNYWAQAGFADLQAKQKDGKLPPYLLYDLVQLAQLPKNPTYFQTNAFVFAGAVIGLLAGILLVSLPIWKLRRGQ